MNQTWFISDTHFGHKNIITYCNRPFAGLPEMDQCMIDRWNSVVKPNDTVWHLGDFAFRGQQYINLILNQLNGRIKLIKGNHDGLSNSTYRGMGFVEVYDYPIVLNEFMVLSHEPMPFVPSPTMINLYGHVHDSPMFETWGKQCACMCVERHNYKPVSLEEIAAHFKEPEVKE